MANTGGTGGTVTITTTASGSTVMVTWPGGAVDIYDPCLDPFLRRFEHAMPPCKVDVTVNAAGAPLTVTAK